jgi:hypothetical protein
MLIIWIILLYVASEINVHKADGLKNERLVQYLAMKVFALHIPE